MEVEVKILNIHPASLRDKLQELGAHHVFSGKVWAVSLDFPTRILAKQGELLRLRQKGNEAELTFKGTNQSEGFKAKNEINVKVGSYESILAIFKALGMEEHQLASKHRETYQRDAVLFEIDEYPDIPPLLEIEGASEADVKEHVEKLGYSMDDTTKMTANEVLSWYQSNSLHSSNQK